MESGDRYYDEVSDAVQPGYPEFEYSNAQAGGMIDNEGHMQAEDLKGAKTIRFWATIPAGETLETLHAKYPKGFVTQIPAHLRPTLGHVMTDRNRANATEKDMYGNRQKAVIVSARIISQKSDVPKAIAVDIKGVVGNTYTRNGRHAHVLHPCKFTNMDREVNDPDNIFSRAMYQKNQRCDLASLQENVRLNDRGGKDSFRTGTLAWDKLLENEPVWDEMGSEFQQMKADHPYAFSESNVSYWVDVPHSISRPLYKGLEEQIKNFEKTYIDLDDWNVTLKPADGKAWNDNASLLGDSVNAKGTAYERETMIHKPMQESGVEVELKYFLNR